MEKSRRPAAQPFVSPYLKEPLRSLEEVQQARQAKLDKLARGRRFAEQREFAPQSTQLRRFG